MADLTVNSNVSGASIRTAFNQYYDARAVLINAVTNKVNEKAQDAAQAAQQKANEADAKANLSKAVTDKFATTVDGGLISAVMLILRALNSQTETAGISGIQGANLNNPAFWAGGTYGQAFALIDFLLKISQGTAPSAGEYDNLAKITMLHNGAAKVGAFIVEESGRIILADPATGKARLIFNVMDIPTVADLMGNTNFSGSANIGSGSTGSSTILTGSTNVTKDNAKASFGGVTISISAIGRLQPSGMSSYAAATLYARRNGVRYMALASASVMFTSDNNVLEDDNQIKAPFNITSINAGNYTFELVVEKEGTITSATASVTTSNFSWEFVTQGVRQQQYGLNGMMFFYSDNHFHYTENGGLDLRGKTNMPGVLAAGSSTSTGMQSNVWGAKSNPGGVTLISGGFRVPLSDMPHGNYVVQITPHTNATFRVGTKTATYFEIFGTGGFDYIVIGKNYA